MKFLKRGLAVLGLGIVAFTAFAAWKIGPQEHHRHAALRHAPGRLAESRGPRSRTPFCACPTRSGTTRISDHIGGKPLVLVFGSFT